MNNTGTTTITKTGKKITVIPANKSLHPEQDGVRPERMKKRVAAYCRVSTLQEEQQGSYDLQQKYFESLIINNPKWELAGIYGDEGKSGTSLKGRIGFLKMMDDVRAGKIDLILAKASSRFGRNNAEFIAILDELDSYGVEVQFESEGVLVSGKQNRIMLQMMGVTNEHYSSTLSNNVRWSKERNMRKGQVTFCYKRFLGYEKGEDGKPKIVEEEAKVVRLIYELFLEGKPYTYIANYLTENEIPTPTGNDKWSGGVIKSILTNEKYTGDALLQKTYRRDYLDKKARKNTGEKAQIVVENNHPAIIDKDTFSRVQELVKARSCRKNSGTSESPFVGRIICADCGGNFGRKSWVSRGRIKYDMWVCNNKYTDKTAFTDDKCNVANLRQEWIETGYIYAMGQLLARKSQILAKYERKLARIEAKISSREIETALDALVAESRDIDENMMALRGEWEFTFGDKTEFFRRRDALKEQMIEIQDKAKLLENERAHLSSDAKQLKTFICALTTMPEQPVRFKGKDFINTIDRVEVSSKALSYCFYGGESVKVSIEIIKKMI